MRITAVLGVLLSSLMLVACNPIESIDNMVARRDIKKICSIAENFKWESYDNAADAIVSISEEITSSIYSRAANNIIRGISHSGESYELFIQGAREVGLKTMPPCEKYEALRKYDYGKLNPKFLEEESDGEQAAQEETISIPGNQGKNQ